VSGRGKFDGSITEYDKNFDEYKVDYDNGDVFWENLFDLVWEEA
jgi:hypothetical protein